MVAEKNATIRNKVHKHLSFSSSASLVPSGGATKGGKSSLLHISSPRWFGLYSLRLVRSKRWWCHACQYLKLALVTNILIYCNANDNGIASRNSANNFPPARGQHQLWMVLVSPPPLHCHNPYLLTHNFLWALMAKFLIIFCALNQLFLKHHNYDYTSPASSSLIAFSIARSLDPGLLVATPIAK